MATDELADDDRAVVAKARGILTELLDEVRGWLRTHGAGLAAEVKGDGTPVTEVDLEVDRILVSALTDAFPAHGAVSEERSTRYEGQRFAWVIDPIDGTSNLTAGLPWWCVSVALVCDGRPVLAAVDAPLLDVRYVAELGRGATRDGEPIRVVDHVDFTSGRNRHVPVMLTVGSARRMTRKVRLNPRIMGAVALDLCAVADGSAAAAISRVPKVWDVAAGALLVTEAGGAFVTLRGDPLLPLQPDTDYVDRSAVCGVGPDADYVRRLAAELDGR